jgi:hypothetical protein
MATARTHKCAEVFDANHIPHTAEEIALFRQKQLFMYSVFDEKPQMDMGKNLVRSHEAGSDAQAIYTLLAEHATMSTRADIESQRILSYITSTRFKTADSGWRGTSHSFILHWQNNVKEYQDMVPPDNNFASAVKLSMLQNAVSGVPELHAVKVQASYNTARGLVALSYKQYCNLLLATASNYDLKNGPTKVRDRRAVNIHQMDDYVQGYEQSDIDTDVETLMVNAHDQRKRFGTHIDIGIWSTMSPNEKGLWSGLSNEVKASILGSQQPGKCARKHEPRTPNRFPPRRPNDNKSRTFNLHDISAYDYTIKTCNISIHNHFKDS